MTLPRGQEASGFPAVRVEVQRISSCPCLVFLFHSSSWTLSSTLNDEMLYLSSPKSHECLHLWHSSFAFHTPIPGFLGKQSSYPRLGRLEVPMACERCSGCSWSPDLGISQLPELSFSSLGCEERCSERVGHVVREQRAGSCAPLSGTWSLCVDLTIAGGGQAQPSSPVI